MDLPEPFGPKEAGQETVPGRQGPPAVAARRLSRRHQIGAVVVVAGLLALTVLLGQSMFGPPAETPVEQTGQATANDNFKPTPQQWATFTTAPVQRMTFRAAQDTDGKIAVDDDMVTPVFSPFTGRVTRLFARTGDHVKRGDPLLAVQATELAQGENDLISAAATLNTAHAQLNLAQTNEKRQHALYVAQGGALKDWQQSQVDLANAEGGLRSAEIALGAVRNRLRILGKSDPEIDTMETAPNIQQFSAEVRIAAPIDGTIAQRQVGLGQNIVSQSNGGTTPVFSIGDFSRVWLLANARETDAPLIHVGDPVEVRVLAYPGRVFKARISYVASSIDPNTHRLPVRAEVENADGALKPEMFASFTIVTGDGMALPSVPETAVVYEGSGAHVWVAQPQEKTIALRQIRTGRIGDGMVQVMQGLQPGEIVVTRGSLFIDRATSGG
ncbi:MAG: efflux RND transporter periplasmic adaptor subunit [Rhodopila sp.]|nr:efflux RND transporter periplasmic adaptor subunit [Rhodopila sp.]